MTANKEPNYSKMTIEELQAIIYHPKFDMSLSEEEEFMRQEVYTCNPDFTYHE